jgi:hypothetical protein
LVIPASKAATAGTVQLDAFVPLLNEIAECKENVKFWETRLARLEEALSALMGDATVGRVAGNDAVIYEPTARFRGGDFKKKYPNLAKAFTREVPKMELDINAIKLSRPDLYAEFQVRPMRVVWEPPGPNGTP